jgi:hypothetical protein
MFAYPVWPTIERVRASGEDRKDVRKDPIKNGIPVRRKAFLMEFLLPYVRPLISK